jgi:hypothetical protein
MSHDMFHRRDDPSESIAVSLDDAEPGMILAADLTDGQGSVLLPRGVALTAANIASLRRRGIAGRLTVVTPALEDDGAGNPLDAAAAREAVQQGHQARLVRLFRGSAGVGASAMLLQLLQDYRRGN